MRTPTIVKILLLLCGLGTTPTSAADTHRPHGYRTVDLTKPYQRTYGGYWWLAENGDICEEGITVQGRPLVCSKNTMLVLNASTGEAGDLHFVDGDIRRTWINGSRSTGLHVFTKLCSDPLVGSWGTYVPVSFRFRPGVMVEDARRPGYTETYGATHQVGALTYKTRRAKTSPLEVKQVWYVSGTWCMVDSVELRNLTEETDDEVAIAVGMNLRTPVRLDRKTLDWFADFHSNGKAGVPMVPRLTDDEYRRLLEMKKFHVEYRPADRCIVARTGWHVRRTQPSFYFACLMLDAPVAHHVLSTGGTAQQPQLFSAGKGSPKQVVARAAVIGLRSEQFRLGAKKSHTINYAIAFGRTADEAVANARQGLRTATPTAIQRTDDYWTKRLPAYLTGNATLNAMLRYAAITEDANWEPDGRAPGDLGGWDRPTRAELCGYKNYYDQTDMVVPLLDMPVYDPQRAKNTLRYDVDPTTGRLRKLIIWRQQYDSMLYWPGGVFKVWIATGDDAFLKEIYPALNNTMRWLHKTRTEPDGLLRMLTMPYDMFTIGLGDDHTVTLKAQALAFDACRAMRDMARHLNKPEDMAFYEKWRSQVKKTADAKFWQGRFYGMCLDFPHHITVSGNACAVLSGLCDHEQAQSISREIGKLYTGAGFPELHPPVPEWVGTGRYSYQNGDMYVDQLALIARVANKTRDASLLSTTFFELNRIVQRWKCFPVTIHPWDGNHRGGVNEIHSASALIACLIYGVAGVDEQKSLRFRPILIPEVGGRVEIFGYLFRGTRFDIRLEGMGMTLESLLVDGKELEQDFVPAAYYDRGKHTVTVRVKE